MKTSAICLTLLLAMAGCGGSQPAVQSVPGHGAIAIEVIPNPIVAIAVSGDNYEVPFEVVIRETGGRPVTVQRVTATVFLGGGLQLGQESWDTAQIRSLGYNTTLAANSEARYKFSPRKEVPDDRVFGSLSAELKVEAVDDSGTATSATTRVTVRK
jgi:hypothetical protein